MFWLSIFLMLSMIFSLGKHEIQASEGNPVAPVNIDMSIDNLFVGVGSKGFHPSSGNHLAIRTSVSCNTKQYFDGEIQLRLRILNKYCRCKIWFFCSREFLKNTDFDITDIATFTGYNDASYFTQIFRKSCGMTPSEYRILERKKEKQNSDI